MGYTFLDSSLDVVLNHFNRFDTVAIDLETSGLSPLDSRLLLCQVGFPDHQYVIDARKVSLTPLIPFLESNKWTKIFFNGKFDCGFLLHNFNCSVKNIFDCFLAERVLYSDAKGGQSFEDLALKYLGVSLNKAVRKSFYGKSSAEFTEDQIKYSAEDVQYLFPLMEAQVEELSKKDLLHIARLEFDLVPTVSAMEVTGVPIDKNKWRGILGEYAQEQSASRLKLLSIFFSQNPDTFTSQLGLFEQDDNALPEGVKELNLGSHLQIKEAFKRLGINLDKTDERMLQTINHPAAKELLVYRGLDKIRTSYGEKSFIDKIHPFTGRIHANWQQVGTETGRFACKDPNLQQMPEKFRSCVVAQAGFTIIGADFSQMELRILAQESKDPVLMAAFLEGKDVHTATASTMFNIPFDKVTKEQRFTAKCVTGNTLIDTSEGLIPIKFLSDFREADTFTDNINLTVFNSTKNKTKVDSFYYGGIQPCKKVTLVGGRVIEGTPNHKIKILEEGIPTWKRLDDISIGDAVHLVERGFDDNSYQTVKFNFWNSTNIKIGENLPTITFDEAWAEIFGVIFGDGNISGHSIDIAGHLQDMDVLENFRALCRSVGIETTLKETKKDNFKVHVGSRRLRRFLNLFDVKGPHIPSIITNSPRTVVCSYIRGLYDTDGWHSKDTIGFCSQHETFIRELQIVLGRLGIFSSIEKTFNTTYQKFYWKLLISSIADAQLYSTLIGFTSSRKRLNPKAILNQGRLSKPRKRNLVKLIENSVQEVFDLYIPEGNEFIGNGMVNHNTLNFGITYGMGPPKFADMLSAETKKSVSIQQAANLMERYKDTYKTASRWLEQMSMSALRDGYVQTIYGRKRYFNPVSIELPAKQYKAQVGSIKRQGANTPIQGTNADITKMAMIQVYDDLRDYGYRGSIILQVHDEIVILAHKSQAESIKPLLVNAMVQAGQRLLPNVPVKVDSYVTEAWKK